MALLVAASRPHLQHTGPNPPCADVGLYTSHAEPVQIPPNEIQPLLSLWWKMCLTGFTEGQAHLPTTPANLYSDVTCVAVELYSPYHCRFHLPGWERSVLRPLRKQESLYFIVSPRWGKCSVKTNVCCCDANLKLIRKKIFLLKLSGANMQLTFDDLL